MQPGTSGAIWLRFVAAFVLLFLFWFSISAIISLQLRTAIDQWPFQLYAAWIAAYGCWFILKKWFAAMEIAGLAADLLSDCWLAASLRCFGSLGVDLADSHVVNPDHRVGVQALAQIPCSQTADRSRLLAKNLIGVVLVVGLFWVTSSIVNISQTLPTTQRRISILRMVSELE